MFRYEEFILESQLDSISESIVYFSPNLRKLFKRLSNVEGSVGQVADALVDLESKNLKDDITFIDFDKDPSYISFTTAKNARKNLNIQYPEVSYGHLYTMFDDDPMIGLSNNLYALDNEIWTKSRSPVRIGRFLNRVFPKKFTPAQIEEFTNKFKSVQEKKGERFLLVKGDDIAFWYNSKNYFEDVHTIGNSCMKSKPATYFEIYIKNPDKCQMLCVVEENEEGVEKLKGRALLWKIDEIGGSVLNPNPEKFEYFLDRQYAIDDSIVQKMRDYASSQGWALKSKNNHSSLGNVEFNSKVYVLNMSIKLDVQNFVKFPYMDTFRRYNPFNGILYNDDSRDYPGEYILEDTGGGFEEISDGTMLWSEYYDAEIPEDEAVWSGPLDTHLRRNASVEVTSGSRMNRGFYPEDYDYIVYSNWSEEYLHIEDATYSDCHDGYILTDESISVVHSVNGKTGECNSDYYPVHGDYTEYVSFQRIDDLVWYQNIVKKNRNWEDHSGILKELLTLDTDGDWILEKFKIILNKVKNPIIFRNEKSFEWIQKIDANLLDIDILEETKISDAWSYTDDLKEANLIDKLEKSIDKSLNSNQITLKFGEEFDEQENKRIENLKNRKEQLENFLVE